MWVWDFFRAIVINIDALIYNLIGQAYIFVMKLAPIHLFTDDNIQNLATKIYSIIGIVMVIKLAFSLVGYIADPDAFYDKNKGFGEIIKRVVIILFLIAAVPTAFKYMAVLEEQVVKNQIIEKLILGKPEYEVGGAADPTIDTITGIPLRTFLKCDTCGSGTINTSNMSTILVNINVKIPGTTNYKYDYYPIISTLAAGFILYLLIMFAFDLALRIVKLGFLQIIAPIPIISYIDPKNSFSSGIMGNWIKETTGTYLMLFSRLLTIAFMIYAINLIPTVVDINTSDFTQLILSLFIIMGILMFAKMAPKLISDMLGIKMSEGGNPFKRMIGGGLIGGALGLGTGLAMRGLAVGAGSLRGGFNSYMRDGSFKGGAIKGAMAASKDIPLKGGFGKQATALWKGGRAAADAGATVALGVDTKTGFADRMKTKFSDAAELSQFKKSEAQKDARVAEMDKYFTGQNISKAKPADVAKLFRNQEFSSAYLKHAGAKDKLTTETKLLDSINRDFTQKQSELAMANQLLIDARASGDTARQDALRGQISALENEKSRLAAHVERVGNDVKAATAAEETAKAEFEVQQKMHANYYDNKTLDTFKRGKGQGKWNS